MKGFVHKVKFPLLHTEIKKDFTVPCFVMVRVLRMKREGRSLLKPRLLKSFHHVKRADIR